jgi:polysaccharide biosynthesis/export protein
MKPVVLFAFLIALALGGCSWIPRAGPSTSEVREQGQSEGKVLYDVVEVDDRVVSTLLAQPKESFAARFGKDTQPPEIKIAIGDTVSVFIWESAAGGLFTEPLPTLLPGTKPQTEPLAPESQPPGERQNELPSPGQFLPLPSTDGTPQQRRRPAETAPGETFPLEAAGATPGRKAAVIPLQQVGADGGISVPYAGRIPAAGQSPAEVQQTIEARLAEKALQPQTLVIVATTAANTVTVILNETAGASPGGFGQSRAANLVGNLSNPISVGVAAGARVPLSIGGDRLLQVIAAAGGAKVPVHETFVRLSRGGVTATIPLRQLVSDPAENIYSQPGDVLTLIRLPQTFNVFGATGRNAEIPFDAERISIAEALAKSQGLRDDLAKPEGVFLFRYEPDSIVRALDEPITAAARGGVSPIVYRFNLRDGKTYLLAQQFPVHDKDVLFVSDAPAAQVYKFFAALNNVTGPIVTGLVTCRYANC